jgi:SAM-dependent methyltransferase
VNNKLIDVIRKHSSARTRRWVVRITRWPPVGWVNFGSYKRLKPISPYWGTERGTPIDRYYIETFLNTHTSLIYGHVLEIGDNSYTLKYGGSKVVKSEVLHVAEQREVVTIIGDLTNADHVPSNEFDCIILTQTLQLIYDIRPAIKTVYRILKPGGCALITVPGISQISRYDMDRWGDYWRFTTKSMEKLLSVDFPVGNLEIKAYGNVKASIAFLHGIAYEELRTKDLDYFDPDYELLITVQATKPE